VLSTFLVYEGFDFFGVDSGLLCGLLVVFGGAGVVWGF